MSHLPDIPPLVARALRQSLELGYVQTTRTETGRLLASLAASCTGTVAECGSGCGVGAAWLRTGAPASTHVLTAEIDANLADRAHEVLDAAGVEVIHAQFAALGDHGPFSLLFTDIGNASAPSDYDFAWNALADGGLLVLDDLSPSTGWPPQAGDGWDESRLRWLTEPRFISCEVMVAPDTAVMICAKRPVVAA